LNNAPAQTEVQVKSMKNVNGLLEIELPGGLILTGPCLLAPLPPGVASRLRADAVPDHFWMMEGDDSVQHVTAA
jgi:hypothetical protein